MLAIRIAATLRERIAALADLLGTGLPIGVCF